MRKVPNEGTLFWKGRLNLRFTLSLFLLSFFAIHLFAETGGLTNHSSTANSAFDIMQSSSRTIKGKVFDELNEPLVGATISIPGTTCGTLVDINGNFTLLIPEDIHSNTMQVSYIGYKSQTLSIKDKTEFNIKLELDSQLMEDVVVVGYGTSSVKDLTGSVASVGARQLDNLNTPNVSSMLQNLAAGVQVSQNTGRPGETVRVRVRGATSLTGSNDPLYVIDGIPVEDPKALDILSSSDIQSMDVLKDASSAAIYGSRAANGVVIITTKKGTIDSKPTVNFNYRFTADTQIKNFKILYGDEWRNYVEKFARETLIYDPSNETAEDILNIPGYLGSASTNWFKEVKQNAMRHDIDLSVAGGSKNSRYRVALSILDQKGMVIGDDMKRYNARIVNDYDVTSYFRVGINASFNVTNQNTSGTSMFTAQGTRPDLPIYDKNGNYDMTTGNPNPVANTNRKNASKMYRGLGTIYGEVDIWDGLKFKSSLSGNFMNQERETFTPSYLSRQELAYGQESHGRSYKTVFDNLLSYNKQLNKNHALDALIGVSFENSKSRNMNASGNTYPDDDIYTDIGAASVISGVGSGSSSTGLFSSFGRINYRLMERYLFTFTGRYDGSSMFGKNNKYGFFPSGAIAWRISEESFMQDIDFVNELKLRGSVGVTGTQNLSAYGSRDLYGAINYGELPGIIHSQTGNRDIRWEKSTQYDVGVDFTLWDNKIRGSLTGYYKDTKDLIWQFNFANSTMAGSMYRNIGAVTNKGIEFNITGYILDTPDWGVDVSLNLSRNKNKVTRLVPDGAIRNAMDGVIIQAQGGYQQVLAEGYPMGVFFGYEYNGIIQDWDRVNELNQYAKDNGQTYYDGSKLRPGQLEIKDLDGNGKIDDGDRVILGKPDPHFFGGLTANARYKDFTLFANFGFQAGGKKIYNKTLQNMPAQLTGLIDYGLNDRWSDENRDAKYPALYIGDGVARETKMSIHDASYFRLQELKLAYNIPFIKYVNGQVFVSATNLFTISSYPGTDPATINSNSNYGGNSETSYPGIRSFSLGFKVSL